MGTVGPPDLGQGLGAPGTEGGLTGPVGIEPFPPDQITIEPPPPLPPVIPPIVPEIPLGPPPTPPPPSPGTPPTLPPEGVGTQPPPPPEGPPITVGPPVTGTSPVVVPPPPPIQPPIQPPPTEPTPPNRAPIHIPIHLPPVVPVPPFGPFRPVSGPTLGGNFPPTIPGTNIPVTITLPSPTVNVTESLLPTPVTVIVNNLETIGADVVSTISGAIVNGLSAIEGSFNTAIQQEVGGITYALGTLASSIGGFLQDALRTIASHIGDLLKSIAEGLGNIVKQIVDAIAPILKDIADKVYNLIKDLPGIIATVLKDLDYFLQKYVIPITNAIRRTFQVVQALITAIHNDLHQGITGLLAIPGQISGAIEALDATFYRLWQEIRPGLKDDSQTNISYGVSQIGSSITGALGAAVKAGIDNAKQVTTFGASDTLSDPTIGSISGDVLSCLTNIVTTSLNTWRSALANNVGQGQTTEDQITNFVKYVFTEFFNLLIGALSAAGVAHPMIGFARQQADKCVPIETLGPSDMVEARIRSFVDDATYNEELRRQGIDATRSKLLLDLAKQRISVADLVDFNYRGVITDSDFQAGLADLGYTPPQAQAIKEASPRLPGVDEILLWLRRGVIDQDAATSLLGQLRYRAEQSQAVLATYKTPTGVRLRSDLQGLLDASASGWLQDSLFLPVPQEVIDAGVKEGLEEGHVRLLWLNHWTLPPYTQLIESYFRGFRTYTEVIAAMVSQNIPRELHNELVENARPLIPYRSIPSFVKAGAMSPGDATQELTRHGFDSQHINWILNVLKATKNTVKTTAASTAHATSIATARTLFDDGAITKDQYIQVLIEHSYTQDLATVTADVEEVSAHVKHRKALIADQLAEVLAGVVTLDSASSTLAAAGATEAELAKFHLQAAKGLRLQAKHPSISELDKFAKAKLITQTQYRDELVGQGWGANWVNAFAALIFPDPSSQYAS